MLLLHVIISSQNSVCNSAWKGYTKAKQNKQNYSSYYSHGTKENEPITIAEMCTVFYYVLLFPIGKFYFRTVHF